MTVLFDFLGNFPIEVEYGRPWVEVEQSRHLLRIWLRHDKLARDVSPVRAWAIAIVKSY